jgi:uncharacterized membrane protein
MTKKDRIAISISIVILFLTILWAGEKGVAVFVIFGLSPVGAYWLYRFIKNDLSFLQRNIKTLNNKDNAATRSMADELLKWNNLLDKGAITQEEYDKAKQDLLG